MKKCKQTKGKNLVDPMMRNVALSLIRDFRHNLNDDSLCCSHELAIRTHDVTAIRKSVPATDDEMSIAKFKAVYQIQSVMKRYRYQDDTYSDQELTEKAIDSFYATQDRLHALDLETIPAKGKLVLDVARDYIARILGVYDDEECRVLCRFGSKASVGIPAALACEAARWELPISGSLQQIAWFRSEMDDTEHVQEYWRQQLDSDRAVSKRERSIFQPISCLKLTLVPKTFKSFRAIMPNTTIGSYMSYGIGEIIRKRLKREGYDIRSLQTRHRYLACQASQTNLSVTADLSSASDSISVALVKRLLPPDWVEILTRSRIADVMLPDETVVQSETFCTMGIGYTFPLQTLIFLALLKAVEATMFHRLDRRTISVYGDDMIYNRRMHSEVVEHLSSFGFVINVDKTFHDGHFRESCGGDYYHGVDVRPFQPRNGAAVVSDTAYEAILYKFINGLLMRWTEYEIEYTLNFLLSEVVRVTSLAKIVPHDYPDDSGIKCPAIGCWKFLAASKYQKPVSLGNGVYRFSYLVLKSKEREEKRHAPYYWLSLRGLLNRGISTYITDQRNLFALRNCGIVAKIINLATGIAEEGVSPLKIRTVKPIETYRSELTGRRLRRKMSTVAISHTGQYKRRSGTSCFEDRRC